MTPQEIHSQFKKVLDDLSEIDSSETFTQMLADNSFLLGDDDMGHLIHQVEEMLAAVNAFAKTKIPKSPKMPNINHRNVRLISEDLTAYDTTISCELPMPKYIGISKKGKLFQKTKTIFESGQSRVTCFEVLVTELSNVEVLAVPAVDAKYSVLK